MQNGDEENICYIDSQNFEGSHDHESDLQPFSVLIQFFPSYIHSLMLVHTYRDAVFHRARKTKIGHVHLGTIIFLRIYTVDIRDCVRLQYESLF